MSPLKHSPPAPENLRLLIVDDEPEIRRGYRDALNPEAPPQILSSRMAAVTADARGPQFEITEAESGDQALEIVQSELAQGRRFAGAIVDVRMPGKLDGLQFIREAWKSDPNLLVVVATAYQDRSVNEIDRIFSTQFQDQWDYLTKPFTAGEITQKARQLVSSWNRRDRERAYLARIHEQQQTLISQEKLAAIGRLARSVGHEFGNVLQPLITKLEITRRKVEPGHHPIFDEMIEAAELGSHICKDLLTFARETHETSHPPEVAALEPVQRAVRILAHNLKHKDVQVLVEVPETLMIRCHESRMVQVLINLITNSLDAVAEGGEIRVSGQATPTGGVQMTVADNGGGIPLDVQHLIFQPLFTTKGRRGNGLGMPVCKQIIEEYGGQIRVESRPEQGTRVIMEFPPITELGAPAPQS